MSNPTPWILSAFADEAGASCEEQIQALQRAGLNYIDIRNIDGFNIVELPIEQAREIKSKLDAANIQVNMFGTPIGKINITDDFEIDLQQLRHLGELAPVLGCNQARIFSYYNKDSEWSHEKWQAESIRRLRTLRDEAKTLGLVLFHENERHIFGDLCKDVQTISDEVRDGETFRLIFDFDNYSQSEEDVWQNWEQLRDITDAFHLKDSTKDKMHVPVGQGNGRVRDILRDALQSGWDGPLSLEPHLSHSGAVAATGPGGKANVEYSKMPRADRFHVATTIAQELLNDIDAKVK